MHESRGFPRFLPRTGKHVSITFGNSEMVQSRIHALRGSHRGVTLNEREFALLRASITSAVQEGLEKLGETVSGSVKEDITEAK